MSLSVLGLYQWQSDIFDSIRLPASVSHETFIDNLLMECAELEILYTDPSFCKFAFGVWSMKMIESWEHFEKTMHFDYDPISNYDRMDTRTINRDSESQSESDSNSNSTGVDKVSAFDSGDFANAESSTANSSVKATGNSTGKEKTIEENRSKGNIGVTTTQTMIRQERDIIANLYDRIISDFKFRFCLTLY